MALGRFACVLVVGAVACGPVAAKTVEEAARGGSTLKVAAASVDAGASRSAKQSVGAKPVKVAAVADPAVAKSVKPKAKPKKKKVSAPSLKISIDLTGQRMTVRENGKTKYTWKISSGRKGFRTPTGTYRPKWMTKMHYSRKYDNAPMPHSIFFHGGYAIHATYATGALGRPASHGCIRLSPANAKRLFRLVQKHKKVRTRIAISGVARDRTPAVARKKRTKRRSAGVRAKPRRARNVQQRRTTYSYAQPSYGRTWPGDQPRRRYGHRYGY